MAERNNIMLCYTYTDKRFESWGFTAMAQPKLEGDRCRAEIDENGKVQLLSSSSQDRNFSVPHIVAALEELNLSNVEFDGELYIHNMPHELIRSRVSRTTTIHPDYSSIEYHIYDIIANLPQDKRLYLLQSLVPNKHNVLKKVATFPVNTKTQMFQLYNAFLSSGYEGIILRSPKDVYTRKKSTCIMKLKPKLSDWFKVIGFLEEYTIDGVPKNSLGSVRCITEEGMEFNCGVFRRPLDKEVLRNIWKKYKTEDVLPKQIKIRYQALTEDRSVPKMMAAEEFIW